MSTVFYSFNLVDDAIITGSTEDASFPASNISDSRRTKTWRTTTNTGNVIFDLRTSEKVDSVILVDHPDDGFGFTGSVTIEANPTADFSAPAFSTSMTASDIDSRFGFAFKEFTEESYRFWRLVFTGSTVVELSNVFLGKKLSMALNGFQLGWSYQEAALDKVVRNRSGQTFADVIGYQKKINADISAMNVTEVDQFLEIYDYNGISKPLFFRFDNATMINDVDRFSGMFFLEKMPELENIAFGLYNASVNFIEAK